MKIVKSVKFLILIGAIVIASSCNNSEQQEMTTDNNTSIFPKGESVSSEWFSGNAFLMPLLAKDKNNDFSMGNVTFEPNARTHWHTHPRGQVLLITEGEGWYQEKGKPAQLIRKGDVINIPEDVEHWHGASANSNMVHIAITNYQEDVNVIWMAPVTDEEYKDVNEQ